MKDYYGDPPEDFCEKCEELGLEECVCHPYDPNDPLEQDWVDDNDGLTKQQTQDIEADILRQRDEEDGIDGDLQFIRDTYL